MLRIQHYIQSQSATYNNNNGRQAVFFGVIFDLDYEDGFIRLHVEEIKSHTERIIRAHHQRTQGRCSRIALFFAGYMCVCVCGGVCAIRLVNGL